MAVCQEKVDAIQEKIKVTGKAIQEKTEINREGHSRDRGRCGHHHEHPQRSDGDQDGGLNKERATRNEHHGEGQPRRDGGCNKIHSVIISSNHQNSGRGLPVFC
jgi:hypothetical protein